MSDILEKRNRVDIRFNGKLIFGASFNCERPNNSDEIKNILKDIISIIDANPVKDSTLF